MKNILNQGKKNSVFTKVNDIDKSGEKTTDMDKLMTTESTSFVRSGGSKPGKGLAVNKDEKESD